MREERAGAGRLRLLVACTGVLVVVGVLQTAHLLARGAPAQTRHAHLATAPATDVGRDVATSFGVVAAESVRTLGGLGARPLAGVTHGIQNLVGPRQMQVQVLVALTNELPRTVTYGPGRFALRVGRSAAFHRPRAATLPAGSLQPQASIEGRLVFVAPRTDGRLLLRFSDRSAPVVLDLGRAVPGRAPPDYAKHHH